MILATVLQTASQSTGMFLASRFFIGFGNSWASISAPIWLTELAFPTHRGPLTSMYNSFLDDVWDVCDSQHVGVEDSQCYTGRPA